MAEFRGLKIGLQSHCLNKLDIPTIIDRIAELGLCYAEFTTRALPVDDIEAREKAMRLCAQRGITINACGVAQCPPDEAECRALFEHAKALGVETICAFPLPGSADIVNGLVAEYGIPVGIHNAGPEQIWSSIESIETGLGAFDQSIGVCVDTGHFTRMGIDPIDAMERFSDRLHAIHLKDRGLDIDGVRGEEFVVDDGPLNLRGVLMWLIERRFNGPVSIEFERVGLDDPMSELRESVKRVITILSEIPNVRKEA